MSNASLPQPSTEELQHSQQLTRIIAKQCPMSFMEYMQAALYEPGYGYYSSGKIKFGAAGDYITAPMISPLFSQCIAKQIAQVLKKTGGSVLELGAGTGVMALEILRELTQLQQRPAQYLILELSADLRQRQQQLLQEQLPDYFSQIVWLEQLPENFQGVIVANEVMDAMPVARFHYDGQLHEYQVAWKQQQFVWQTRPASNNLAQAFAELAITIPTNYSSEINVLLQPWLASLAACLQSGLILLIDYGFVGREYYHPERSQGTLMCHYHHRAHSDPLILTGLQDITAHVDFTAVATAAMQHQLTIAGFTTQAYFLIATGLLEKMQTNAVDAASHYQLANAVKLLTLPSEMGELFKVMALTKGDLPALIGFNQRDLRDRL